ncbi:unnamed protein product [Fraxinus pennsylvanica]|uniref:Uncharacterized protein n=1 Tax=Fraxinus pennsylvanica TaxID=56036 RepID=A0AAD1ZBL0_9LAMI|nr:unnamed protein product [Fraxinus pennsylvanica]
MSGENHNYTSESGSDTTETTTYYLQPINYAVSPRELSLCIHKLIEFRLRVRIEELEIALESIEKEAQTLDLDLCLFCHKRILEEDGQCPGCRNQYDCEPVEGEATLDGGSLTFQLARSCSMISRS